jgi:F0F1-type ATP synthase assembly protein I
MTEPVPSPAPKQQQEEKKAEASTWAALQLAWELGYMISLPAVVFGFAGAFLDKRYGTSPLFLILGFALALLISGVSVVRKVKQVTPK